ncbi:MAG TPA: hypothetical protein VK157_16260 [Phycisphaerales bacterium]|nr:hypothetical protein [Phycisphaerales bacterium]
MVYWEIRATGGVFVRGILPRLLRASKDGSVYYFIDQKDPTGWMHFVMIIVIFPTVIPFNSTSLLEVVFASGGAALLAVVNWMVGTRWAVILSNLGELTPDRSSHLWALRDWIKAGSKMSSGLEPQAYTALYESIRSIVLGSLFAISVLLLILADFF